MGIWQSLGGQIRAEITSARPSDSLRALEKAGIPVLDVQAESEFTISFTAAFRDRGRIIRMAKRRGEEVQILSHSGLFFYLRGLIRRPVLVLGLLILLGLTVWVPGRIFFVQVEGNETVYTRQILEEAKQCGIGFGASRREVRSERVKNALLEEMPQLQWVGVNTYGCVAVIRVQERIVQEAPPQEAAVSSIIASREGVIRSITVNRGSAACSVGQRVQAGDILISGYTDCGLKIQATAASGEIFADTLRQLTAVYASHRQQRLEKQGSSKKYSLIIGKNRINFPFSSGISDTGCVRIYTERYITLPGGFVLPIAIATEESIRYSFADSDCGNPEAFLLPYMEKYVQSQMIGGAIVSCSQVMTQMDGGYRVDAVYTCCEMIGISRPEENVLDYEDRGT